MNLNDVKKMETERAVEPLIATLKVRDSAVRGAVAEALGKIGDARAVEPLIATLKDISRYDNTRETVFEALGKIDAPAFEQMLAALKVEDKEMRQAAAEALGKIGDAHVVERALKDSDKIVRIHTAIGLGKRGGTRAIKVLADALKDTDKDIRFRALVILTEIDNDSVVGPLCEVLNSPDFDRKDEKSAARALVALYRKAKTGPIAKIRILAKKSKMNEKHEDDRGSSDCSDWHHDVGGLDIQF